MILSEYRLSNMGTIIANECIFTRTELSNAHKKLHLQDAKLRLVMSLHYIPVYLTQGYAHATSINVQFLGKTIIIFYTKPLMYEQYLNDKKGRLVAKNYLATYSTGSDILRIVAPSPHHRPRNRLHIPRVAIVHMRIRPSREIIVVVDKAHTALILIDLIC